jgi:hypothetical protein
MRVSTKQLAGRVLILGFALASGCHRPSEPAPQAQPQPDPADPVGVDEPDEDQTQLCDGQPCPAPKQCLSYLGVAGPAGPTFYACEIPCERGPDNDGCPDGMSCVVIADGPGEVCR